VENATSRDIVVIREVSSSSIEKSVVGVTVGPARLNQLTGDLRADLAFILYSEYAVPSQKDLLS
jgi:hypothetical protein